MPFPQRLRLIARMWASQTNPTPFSVIVMYWLKYFLLFIGGWAFWNSFSAHYTGIANVGDWGFTGEAFKKAMAWSILYESIGLGCAFGPMNARFWPPLGGFLHFLRPGTTKLSLFPRAPLIGGTTRNLFDVTLYALLLLSLLRALVAPEVTADLLLPACILLPIIGVADKTIFLAARAEHYLVATLCIVFAYDNELWIPFCQIIWCFIWFWAATSKINHHFPSVIMIMMNNGPFFPSALKTRLFVDYPDDLRPSRFATFMAHFGTVTEYAIPFVLILSDSTLLTGGMLLVMFSFHGFIAANNPAGMPVDWNILMVYGGFFLFGFNPDVSVLDTAAMPGLLALLFFTLVCIPAYGNFVPSRVSFLLAMRYYAGNWAYNVWLFKGDSMQKLNKLKKAAGTMKDQLEKMMDDPNEVSRVLTEMAVIRLMHLQGKTLFDAIPTMVDNIDEYQWMEGEVVAGLALGWNFGDGHLNELQLLEAIQQQCEFEPGELRVAMVEGQPLFGPTMAWRTYDAADGLIAEGETEMAAMRGYQAWPTGKYAAAFGGDEG